MVSISDFLLANSDKRLIQLSVSCLWSLVVTNSYYQSVFFQRIFLVFFVFVFVFVFVFIFVVVVVASDTLVLCSY